MSPPCIMSTVADDDRREYLKGVKLLHDDGVTNIPKKYILPFPDRPNNNNNNNVTTTTTNKQQESSALIKLPVIDMAELQGPNRYMTIKSLSDACQSFGFFQVVNHQVPEKVISNMIDVGGRFFELPYEARCKYMSSNMRAPVRCGTSFNQNKDGVFCWRDFLKLTCDPHPSPPDDVLANWPDSPIDLRKQASTYSKESNNLFVKLMDAILESLGLRDRDSNDEMRKEFRKGSHLMVVNCYPPCPQPDLTLGMPPHSDYGFITLLLQDDVRGLQIQHRGDWVTVDPIPNSFVVNVGDQLEIFSNGLYRSVLHRVLANSKRLRTSIASLHAFPFDITVSPCEALVNRHGRRLYKDTCFADFMAYASTQELKGKDFLESRKLK
ncbi:unnamed protein product [Rhodiola kirilowii]